LQGKFENRRFSKYKIFLAIPRQLAARQLILKLPTIFLIKKYPLTYLFKTSLRAIGIMTKKEAPKSSIELERFSLFTAVRPCQDRKQQRGLLRDLDHAGSLRLVAAMAAGTVIRAPLIPAAFNRGRIQPESFHMLPLPFAVVGVYLFADEAAGWQDCHNFAK